MGQDEIIWQNEVLEMARKSGALDFYEINAGIDGDEDALLAFAKLVASAAIAKEREACAKACAELGEWACVHDIEARGEA